MPMIYWHPMFSALIQIRVIRRSSRGSCHFYLSSMNNGDVSPVPSGEAHRAKTASRGRVWMFSALQGVFDDDLNRRSGASHVSGLYEAALMAAGPDEVRGSDPNQNIEHFAHNP
jgi:hypothetical protein